jgi:acetyl esterase/lipase
MTQSSFTPGSHYAFAAAIPLAVTTHIRRKLLDVPYAERSPQQKLDIYLPDLLADSYPVIVAIHGGAFMGGDKADVQVLPMLEGLKRGHAVVSINYRMSWEALFPALVHDAKAAVRWIRAHAANYGFDPDHIAAWGGSAGGYQSAMLGVSGGITELEDLTLGNSNESSRVQAVVDWFGPTNFLLMDAQLAAIGLAPPSEFAHNGANSPESLLLGAQITAIPDRVHAANPITYVRPDASPFLIQHGDRDPVVPPGQSVDLAHALTAACGAERVTLELLPDAVHADPAFETPQNVARVLDFLDQQLHPA